MGGKMYLAPVGWKGCGAEAGFASHRVVSARNKTVQRVPCRTVVPASTISCVRRNSPHHLRGGLRRN
jgi:hypothetical protein